MDSNVMRVLARLFEGGLRYWVADQSPRFFNHDGNFDPGPRRQIVQSGFDDWDPIVIKVNPEEKSLLRNLTQTYNMGPWMGYPIKATLTPVPVYLTAFIIKDSQRSLLAGEKMSERGLLSGFWHFP